MVLKFHLTEFVALEVLPEPWLGALVLVVLIVLAYGAQAQENSVSKQGVLLSTARVMR